MVGRVFNNLKEPAITYFGDGHSIYKIALMFYEFQRLMKKLIKNIPNQMIKLKKSFNLEYSDFLCYNYV